MRRDGYLDVDAGSPIAAAEVVVFAAAAGQAGEASETGRVAAAVRDEQAWVAVDQGQVIGFMTLIAQPNHLLLSQRLFLRARPIVGQPHASPV